MPLQKKDESNETLSLLRLKRTWRPDNLAENRMLRRSGLVEPVEERVVDSVNEELRTTAVGLACVRH